MCQCIPPTKNEPNFVKYEEPTEFVTVGIHSFPIPPPPPPPPRPGIPEHLRRILEKYPYNWRLEQLSKQVPCKQRSKFTGVVKLKLRKRLTPLHPASEFFSDHLARPPLRTILTNKRLFGKLVAKKRRKYFDRTIKRTWNSIYNYYKKKLRDKKRRARTHLKASKSKLTTKKEVDLKRLETLAQPKKGYVKDKKEPTKKKKKTWKECAECPGRLDAMAMPVARKDLPTNKLGWVNPAALTYTPTENILKLGHNFERFNNILPPLEVGKVKKAALRYKISPRTDALAVPKKRSEKEVEDSEWDPWAISKNALKYKASPRILELAKPKERD